MNLRTLFPIYKTNTQFRPSCKFTVFTPFYNSEQTIHRVFNSLNNQTFKDFELILINDGSTDNSHEIVLELIETASFKVNYINNKENKHKMACLMQAVSLAKGDYFLPFDADDECSDNALEVFNYEFSIVTEPFKEHCITVTALCVDQNGENIGDKFPSNPLFSNTFKSHNIEGIKGEKWGFTKTEVLKGIYLNDYLYSKGLIPEGLLWNLLAKEGFITKYINVHLRVYYLNVENSISSSGIEKNALGAVIYNICNINWFYKGYRFKIPIYFLKCMYFFLQSSVFLDYKLKDYINAIDSKSMKALLIILWPLRRFLK